MSEAKISGSKATVFFLGQFYGEFPVGEWSVAGLAVELERRIGHPGFLAAHDNAPLNQSALIMAGRIYEFHVEYGLSNELKKRKHDYDTKLIKMKSQVEKVSKANQFWSDVYKEGDEGDIANNPGGSEASSVVTFTDC